MQQELEINLELQLKFLAKKNNEKFSALEMNTGAIPWSPTSWGFRCGFVRQSDYKLPQKYYVFQNPIDAEFWTPINGKSRNRTYWQVSVSK